MRYHITVIGGVIMVKKLSVCPECGFEQKPPFWSFCPLCGYQFPEYWENEVRKLFVKQYNECHKNYKANFGKELI